MSGSIQDNVYAVTYAPLNSTEGQVTVTGVAAQSSDSGASSTTTDASGNPGAAFVVSTPDTTVAPGDQISSISTNFTYIGTVFDDSQAVIGALVSDSSAPNTFYLFASDSYGPVTASGPFTVNAGAIPQNADFNFGEEQAVCFLAGTAIATPSGSAAIETLRAGDLVTLADGGQAPIIWLGRQTVSTKFFNPLRSAPIRITAGALGENLPARDLMVSPDHALLVDGILVHAGALVNGLSITRAQDVPASFIYYHVEVANHALILAENVAAETFIDNVDRLAFDNWDEREATADNIPELSLPRAKSARQVPAATRARLLAIAEARFGTLQAAA
jgi:hypothetical protein